jgi:hypothetical protein
MKCKAAKEILNPKAEVTKRGGNMVKGKCACGAGMAKIVSKQDADLLKKSQK